ncbi:MAG: ABC transporter permease [Betaproteobacteria bacterium]|nr:ABC transporter permease [Betaproteobacteria bacterium]
MNLADFTSPVVRGMRNAVRSRARAALVVLLLASVTGFLALSIEAAIATRQQIAALDARVGTLIELREAGAFGTGGFGADKPVGGEHFTTDTLERVRTLASARHLARVDEYIYAPQMDARRKNVYAMVIGLHPGAALRAIGEVDYENARILAGRAFRAEDVAAPVAIVGQLYARQRLGVTDPAHADLARLEFAIGTRRVRAIGIYTTANDFGDNHVFVPIEVFREAFNPGKKLSKIFVTVDSVAHVERVVEELKALPEADVVTTPEAVSTARTTLGSMALASALGAVLLFAIGAILVGSIMLVAMRERMAEIGTLKAIGASNREIALQFVAEAACLSAVAALGAMLVAAASAAPLGRALGVALAADLGVLAWIVLGSLAFAALGSLYPVAKGWALRPVEAMRSEA